MHMRCLAVVLGLSFVGGSLVGCGGLEPVARFEPTTDPAELYMRLTLNHRAITLSTVAGYNTLQLIATPGDGTGTPIPDLPAPTFTSSDTATVWVTPEGQLQARGAATGVTVIASLTAPGNIRHTDTALVTVTVTSDPPPALASLSLDLLSLDLSTFEFIPADSAAMQYCADGPEQQFDFALRVAPFHVCDLYFAATGRDAGGTSIPGLVVEYQSLDPTVASSTVHLDPFSSLPALFSYRPGQVRMVARATAYGVSRADTTTVTVTWPIQQLIHIGIADLTLREVVESAMAPNDVRLAPYGVVAWLNYLSDSVDVTFDDPTNVALPPAVVCDRFATFAGGNAFGPGLHCGTGDVLLRGAPPRDSVPIAFRARPYWTVQARQFPVPGVYRYHTRTGATGRIIVTNDPDPYALP